MGWEYDMLWQVTPTPPARQQQLVYHARRGEGRRPRASPDQAVGVALRDFYQEVLTEPLPPELARLVPTLRARNRLTGRSGVTVFVDGKPGVVFWLDF